VVTLLVVPELVLAAVAPPEVSDPVVPVLALPELPPSVPDPVLAVAVWAAVTLLEAWRASAGSWPETSMSVMNSQVATNIDKAPAITRRRIVRVLMARACLTATARAGPLSVLVGVMSVLGFRLTG
jgi:hypothetical protein